METSKKKEEVNIEFQDNGWIVITDLGIPQVSNEDKLAYWYWNGEDLFIPIFQDRQDAGEWANRIRKRLGFKWYKTIQSQFIYSGGVMFLRGANPK